MLKRLLYVVLGVSSSSAVLAANPDEITWDSIQSQVQQSGSVHLLAKLYGSWVLDLFGGSGTTEVIITPVTVFAALIGVAGWSLFMILAGYVGFVGLIRTAQHGEFLGRDWDSTWVLARMLAALILSAPLAQTGGSANLAAGQTLVIRAAVVSSAAADIVWGKTLTAIGQQRIRSDRTMQVDVNFSASEAMTLINKGYAHGMCYAAYSKYDTTGGATEEGNAADMREKIIGWCRMDPAMFTSADEAFDAFDQSNVVQQRDGDLVVGGVDLWYTPEKIHRGDLIRTATRDIAEQYYFRGFRIGTEQVKNNTSGKVVTDQMLAVARDFQASIKRSIEAQVQAGYNNSAAMYGAEAQRYGWVSAGNFYRVLATQQTAINAALNEAINVGGSHLNPEELTSGLPTDDLVYYNTSHAVSIADRTRELYEDAILVKAAQALYASNPGTIASPVLAGATANALDSVGLNLFRAGETTDPLVASSNIGHGLVALATAGSVAAKVTGVGRAASAVAGDTLGTILFVLFAVGVFLGDILPSLPWVYFLFGTIAWLVHVTEMFVSAPLWIAAHAAPEGSNHTSHLAAKGYNNMLYIMLYPVLAIGGFVAAMSVNWIGMYMLNQLIGEQFQNQLGGGLGLLTHGIGTLTAFAILYLGCAWIIVNTSFNLITAFPRTILNWLSTAEPGLNPYDQGGHQVLGVAGAVVKQARPTEALAAVKKVLQHKPAAGAEPPGPAA